MAEQTNGAPADTGGQGGGQPQTPPAPGTDLPDDIAALKALVAKERGIAKEVIAQRDGLKARLGERETAEAAAAAEAARKKAEEQAAAGNLKPALEQARAEAAEAKRRADALERERTADRLTRHVERALGGPLPEIVEPYIAQRIAAGEIKDEATAKAAAETLRSKHAGLFGDATRIPSDRGPSAAVGPARWQDLKPGDWEKLTRAQQEELERQWRSGSGPGTPWG